MKRLGGFVIVETLIVALIITIIVLGGYYVVKRNRQKPAISSTTSSNPTLAPTQSSDKSKYVVPGFGVQLVNVPSSIQDLFATYYPASTEANYKQAIFSTNMLYLKSNKCSIGELDKYPGKYKASSYQGSATFVKQFDGFWIAEIDVGIPCKGAQKVLDLQNAQINTFKQYVTNPDNLQVSPN